MIGIKSCLIPKEYCLEGHEHSSQPLPAQLPEILPWPRTVQQSAACFLSQQLDGLVSNGPLGLYQSVTVKSSQLHLLKSIWGRT